MQLIISAVNKYTKREGNEMNSNWHSQSSKKLHQARRGGPGCLYSQTRFISGFLHRFRLPWVVATGYYSRTDQAVCRQGLSGSRSVL